MSNVFAIFGASGQQGGSVINHVLSDQELSGKYKIRAITRDTNSVKANNLKAKVEVVQGDISDRTSIERALTGVHTVFAMTTPSLSPNALEDEYNSGKTIADVSVEKGVKYIIFSTLPAVSEISGGKYTKVTPFDAKAKIEQYIRGLHIKSAFFSAGFFMENLESQPFLAPRQAPDGTWILARHISGKTRLPYIDAVGDIGKFVGAILAEPEKYEGKTLCAAKAQYSLEEIATIMSKATGQSVVYKQVTLDEFKESLPFEGAFADLFVEAFSCLEEFGYFGPESVKLIAQGAESVRGQLTTFEEFLKKHPLHLK